jgi:hypothetical protein
MKNNLSKNIANKYMKNKKKLELRKGRLITMDELFKAKEQFHMELSRLPFEEKIKILMKMREIVELKGAS